MDLKSGVAEVTPSRGGALDLAEIPRAIEKAGFSAPKLHVRGAGVVTATPRGLELRIPGQKQPFRLAGGAKLERLKAVPALDGRAIEVTGELTWKKGSPPALSVEDYAP